MKLEDRVKALEEVWAVAFQEQKQRVANGGAEDLALRLARALGPIQDLEAHIGLLRDEVKATDLKASELNDAVSRTAEQCSGAVELLEEQLKEQNAAAETRLEEARQKVQELSDRLVKHEEHVEAHRSAGMESDGEAREALPHLKEALESLERQAEILARHDSELNDMRGTKAIKQATSRLSSTLPTEAENKLLGRSTQERSDLQVYSDRAEWLIRDAFALKSALPKGESMESPRFNLEVPGVGHLHDLCLRFFPNGALHAQQEDSCSLYFVHPLDMPWSKYELAVGRTIQGPFDPIFGGTDDFCSLAANVSEDEMGQSAICIGVRFLAKVAD